MGSIRPSVEELFQTGSRLLGEGDFAGAEIAFRRALRLAPDSAEVHANLGLALERRRDLTGAEEHYRTAVDLAPSRAQIHLNYGVMLASQKRFAEAERVYRHALQLSPDSAAAWSNLGVLLACMKRDEEAEQCHRTAMACAPDYRKASFNLAYLLLRHGRYEEGWAHLEARDWYRMLEGRLHCPRWQGEALQGKSLLIGFEAGHGDMIQFCRYAKLAKDRGAARVSVLCHPGLKSLFAQLRGADEAIALDEPFSADGWDYWTPPLSMPFLFQTRLDTIPSDLPYLAAEPVRTRRWAEVLGPPHGELRVGIVWKGNPRFESDADRSLPSLATMAPMGEVAGVRFFSLQKGAGQEEAADASGPFPLVDLGAGIDDFADTAAIVMNLDLVIAVDTAVVHLAGALGKPCWVLLPDYKTDWRWLADREDSPWYPGCMRLFRQKTAGDWDSVLVEVTASLQDLAAIKEKTC